MKDKLMSEIPCKDCITFPICFSKVQRKYSAVFILCDMCILLEKHYYFNPVSCHDDVDELFGKWNYNFNIRIKKNDNRKPAV